MKKILHFALIIGIIATSCKKEEDEPTVPAVTTPSEKGSNDETARDEYDAAVDDVFKALENTGISTGRTSSNGVILPCGVVKIDSTGGVYRFVYDSTTNCNTRVLSGSITASLISGTKWEDAGAKMELTFTNYMIHFSANNQTLTFNGSLIVTNKNGGKLWHVLSQGGNKTITHTIAGVIQITFDKNDTRSWTISKKRTYESTDGQFSGLTWTLEADGSVAEVGTDKNGVPFTTTIPLPILWVNCSATGSIEGPFKAVSGQLVYTAGPNQMTADAGFRYDQASKKAVKSNDCNSEGYRLTFLINGQKTTTFQYY